MLCCSKDVNQEDALVRRRKVNKEVEKLVDEIFESTDSDALDIVRSRQAEQEVLDILDGRKAG